MITDNVVDRINLAINGGFEAGVAGWDADGGGGTLTADAVADGADDGVGHCAALAYERGDASAGSGTFTQTIPADVAAHLRGHLLSFRIMASASVAGALLPFISPDGGETRIYGGPSGQSWGHGFPGGAVETAELYEPLKLEGYVLPADATDVVFGVAVGQSCTARLDNASLVQGAACAEAQGCVPVELIAALAKNATAAPEPVDTSPEAREREAGEQEEREKRVDEAREREAQEGARQERDRQEKLAEEKPAQGGYAPPPPPPPARQARDPRDRPATPPPTQG